MQGSEDQSMRAPKNGLTWHVVTSQGGIVLGVYGEALLAAAQEQARRVENQTRLPAFVSQVHGARPAVGTVHVAAD
jgi:hypothetical protein